MSAVIDIFKHTLMVSGFVVVMMLVVEYLNILTHGTWQKRLTRNILGQYLLAGLLGSTPGCLGTFAVVGMYGHGMLTHGAVITAMIATMGDESFVMLAMIPRQAFILMGFLLALGIIVGAVSDFLTRRWIPLVPTACKELKIHQTPACCCYPRGSVLRQWRECSAARGILATALSLFILGLLLGQLGPASQLWIRITAIGLAAIALFMVSTVPDHFLEEHLWKHVIRQHALRIFMWTFGALAVMQLVTEYLVVSEVLRESRWLLLLAACLVGLIPESGPHLIFLTLYAQDSIPFAILLASSIVQDGHGMLPLLAYSRKAFLAIKGVNFIIGMLVGIVLLILFKS